jgi:polysaccharide transporter, PST family
MEKNTLLHGALWGTLAVFLSKVLGFIYIVPLYAYVESSDRFVFSTTYRIYAYIILIATAGVPFATAFMISKYNAVKNYAVSFKLLRSNVFLMLFIGLVCSLLLMASAQPLAEAIASKQVDPKIIQETVIGIRIISLALIFVPIVSVVRGFFQGYKEIQISATSQLVEQFINSTFIIAALILAGSGVIASIDAIYFAILCATIASIASLIYLVRKYMQLKPVFDRYYQEGEKLHTNKDISNKKLLIELFTISVPYIVVVLLAQSNDFIDLLYTNRGLIAHGYTSNQAVEFSDIFGAGVNKLLTIPMTISLGLSVALVPYLSEAYATNDYAKIKNLVTKILTGTMVVLIPIVLLMMAMSYETFYVISAGNNAVYGGQIFMYFGIYSIINTFTIIVQNMMLSLAQRKRALLFIILSTVFKLATTYFFIATLGVIGLALSGIIACLVTDIPCMIVLRNVFGVKYTKFFKQTLISSAISILMFIVVRLLSNLFNFDTYPLVFIETVVLYLVGIVFYLSLALKLKLIPTEIKNSFMARLHGLRRKKS